MTEPLEPFAKLDKNTEACEPSDLASDDIARTMGRDESFPCTRCEIFHRKRKTLSARIDVRNDRVYFLVLLEQFFRVLQFLRPRDVRDVNQPVDAFFKLDERTEVGQVANLAVDLRANRIADRNRVPGIILQLLHAEADPFFVCIDAEHLHLDLVALVKLTLRICSPFGPRDLGNVNQALDARLQLDKDPVFGNG